MTGRPYRSDPKLVEKFRRLLTGEEKGYAGTAWEELAMVASLHYEPICPSCGDLATRWGCEECEGPLSDHAEAPDPGDPRGWSGQHYEVSGADSTGYEDPRLATRCWHGGARHFVPWPCRMQESAEVGACGRPHQWGHGYCMPQCLPMLTPAPAPRRGPVFDPTRYPHGANPT